MPRTKRGGEWALLLLLLLFAMACIFFSKAGSKALGMKNEYLTPNTYSNLLSGALALAVIVRGAALLRGACWQNQNGADQEEPSGTQKNTALNVGFMMLCAVLYILGIRHIGFYITTAVSLFVVNMTFEGWKKGHIWKAAVFSLGVCAITLVVFQYLKIFLPKAMFF